MRYTNGRVYFTLLTSTFFTFSEYILVLYGCPQVTVLAGVQPSFATETVVRM